MNSPVIPYDTKPFDSETCPGALENEEYLFIAITPRVVVLVRRGGHTMGQIELLTHLRYLKPFANK